MTLFQLVGKNALRKRRRTLLTLISISFSMTLLSLMMTIWRSFYVDTLGTTSALRLITRPRGSSYFMLAGQAITKRKSGLCPEW